MVRRRASRRQPRLRGGVRGNLSGAPRFRRAAGGGGVDAAVDIGVRRSAPPSVDGALRSFGDEASAGGALRGRQRRRRAHLEEQRRWACPGEPPEGGGGSAELALLGGWRPRRRLATSAALAAAPRTRSSVLRARASRAGLGGQGLVRVGQAVGLLPRHLPRRRRSARRGRRHGTLKSDTSTRKCTASISWEDGHDEAVRRST